MPKQNEEQEKRKREYEDIRRGMLEEGYHEQIETISILKANLMAFVTAGPILLILGMVYFMIRKEARFSFDLGDALAFFVLFLVSIPIHELLHGITWRGYCKNGWKSIHLDVDWKTLTPYCFCKEPLPFGGYLLGGLMPALILGIGSFILALSLGSDLLLAFSFLSILAAGGDLTIAIKLLKYRHCRDAVKIYDHPTECGFVAFIK